MSRREAVRLKLLSKMPKGGVAAEIGVWNGGFSSVILDKTEPARLHLIDPWLYQPDFRNTAFGRPRNEGRMDEMYEEVAARFSDDPRVVLHRGLSDEVFTTFPNDYFDWIYIDGNHNAPHIDRDLAHAFHKVKAGGIISGDDYLWGVEDGRPVRSAVTRFREAFEAELDFRVFGQQWLIRLPETKPDDLDFDV
jgi:hypothetical protein